MADKIRCCQKESGEPILLNVESEAKIFLQSYMDDHRDFITENFGKEDDTWSSL